MKVSIICVNLAMTVLASASLQDVADTPQARITCRNPIVTSTVLATETQEAPACPSLTDLAKRQDTENPVGSNIILNLLKNKHHRPLPPCSSAATSTTTTTLTTTSTSLPCATVPATNTQTDYTTNYTLYHRTCGRTLSYANPANMNPPVVLPIRTKVLACLAAEQCATAARNEGAGYLSFDLHFCYGEGWECVMFFGRMAKPESGFEYWVDVDEGVGEAFGYSV